MIKCLQANALDQLKWAGNWQSFSFNKMYCNEKLWKSFFYCCCKKNLLNLQYISVWKSTVRNVIHMKLETEIKNKINHYTTFNDKINKLKDLKIHTSTNTYNHLTFKWFIKKMLSIKQFFLENLNGHFMMMKQGNNPPRAQCIKTIRHCMD